MLKIKGLNKLKKLGKMIASAYDFQTRQTAYKMININELENKIKVLVGKEKALRLNRIIKYNAWVKCYNIYDYYVIKYRDAIRLLLRGKNIHLQDYAFPYFNGTLIYYGGYLYKQDWIFSTASEFYEGYIKTNFGTFKYKNGKWLNVVCQKYELLLFKQESEFHKFKRSIKE